MIAVAVLAAVCATVLLVLPPGRLVRRRLAVPLEQRAPARRRWSAAAVGAAVVVAVLAAIGIGTRGLAVAVALELVAGTGSLVLRSVVLARRAATDRAEVAHACQVLARLVAVGQTPTEALLTAAEDCPVLVEAATMQRIGGDPVTVWRSAATRPGLGGLLALARAWQISHVTGAAMARPLADAATALRADRALSHVVQSELSAPRATGRLLALLPLVGLVLGYLIGGDPLRFLLDHWVGQLCLVIGVALACTGVAWVERLATQPAAGS